MFGSFVATISNIDAISDLKPPNPKQSVFKINSKTQKKKHEIPITTKRRSRTGCITCKLRKKKCDEKIPVCANCNRLGKVCIWSRGSQNPIQGNNDKSRCNSDELCSKVKKIPLLKIIDNYCPSDLSAESFPDVLQSEVNLLDCELNLTDLSRNNIHPYTYDQCYNSLTIPLTMSSSLNLGTVDMFLYDYYCTKLSVMMSIVPAEKNYYRNVYLPLAEINKAVLYGILAWSSTHIGGAYSTRYSDYIKLAHRHLHVIPVYNDFGALQKIAALLIICGTVICQGDTKHWPRYLVECAELIKERGGLMSFTNSIEGNWIISSFAYHDVLSSSLIERETYFPIELYDVSIVLLGQGVNPLQGLVKPIFNLIGEVSRLAFKMMRITTRLSGNNLHFESYDIDNGNPMQRSIQRKTAYEELIAIANDIMQRIEESKPDPSDFNSFDELNDLELQLTLFEAYQICAKLYVKHSLFRISPCDLVSQVLLYDLINCLHVVLGTKVEGSLCFPIFIAGIHCVTQEDRDSLRQDFDDLIERHKFKNMERARFIMGKVWTKDPEGRSCVDWFSIIKDLGWDLSFA